MLGLQESKQNKHRALKVQSIHSIAIWLYTSAALRKYHTKSFIKKPVNHWGLGEKDVQTLQHGILQTKKPESQEVKAKQVLHLIVRTSKNPEI